MDSSQDILGIDRSAPKAGFVGPLIAVVLALLAGGAAFTGYTNSRLSAVAEHEAQSRVISLASAPNPQDLVKEFAQNGYDARVVQDRAEGKRYAFLKSLQYRAHVDRQGKALQPTDMLDKASADAFIAAQAGTTLIDVQDDGDVVAKRAFKVIDDHNVAVVDAPLAPLSTPWKKLALGALVGFILWCGILLVGKCRRWPPIVGAILAAAAIFTPMILAITEIEKYAKLHAASLQPAGLTLPFAAALLPILVFGVYGCVRRAQSSPYRTAYAYITPAMLGMGLLILVPFLLGVVLAFMHHDHGNYTFVGLDNFISILSSDGTSITDPLNFYFTLFVTILWTLTNVFLHVAIGLALALILKDPTLRFKGVYRVLLIVPWAVPSYITALVWKGMFNKEYGLINNILQVLGIEPVAWFGQFWTSFCANLTTNTWLGFPFMMVVSLGALQSIPKDLYEAAEVDGASKWQMFKSITLPLLKPALFPSIILGSIWTFNMFNIIYLVSGGQPNGATDILIVEAYRYAFEQNRYGYAAAYSMLIFVILWGYSSITSRVAKSAEGIYG